MNGADLTARMRAAVRDVPDFPQPGIIFKDITPILSDAALFDDVISHLAEQLSPFNVDVIAGIESRGFIFGAPLAVEMGLGFVPIRKVGKLPHKTRRVDYDLEYGTSALEAHIDAFEPGQRVLIIDDVLATGGTAEAAARLVQELGADVAAFCILIELTFLNGRERLRDLPLHTILSY